MLRVSLSHLVPLPVYRPVIGPLGATHVQNLGGSFWLSLPSSGWILPGFTRLWDPRAQGGLPAMGRPWSCSQEKLFGLEF